MPKTFLKKHTISFRKRVYNAVKDVLPGRFATYRQIAEKAGSPKAWRAVGNILNKNQNPEIPCHRIIRSDGKIGGYNRGINKKIRLLKGEGVILLKWQVKPKGDGHR